MAPQQKNLETDPRFPSGPWEGFWVQRGWGKQKMSLWLSFKEGRVDGGGRDVIGTFGFTGSYVLESGAVQLVKDYERYRVLYEGANQGDGMWLWGLWTLPGHRGGFHLWPEGQEDPTARRTAVEEELSVPRRRRIKPGELMPT